MKDLDWNNLGFSYIKTDYRFIAHWKDGNGMKGNLPLIIYYISTKVQLQFTTVNNALKA